MKSIKRGRAPSMLGGFMSIAAGLFGIFWTVLALRMGAAFMAPFGLIFVIVAVIQAVYQFKNATAKQRHSEYDITEDHEEPDPWNERFSSEQQNAGPATAASASGEGSLFCPYCGAPVDYHYAFCNRCGKKLPE